MLLDLLWADPAEEDDARGNYFSINNERNCSVFFGEKPVKYIIKRENLIRIVRAHQCVRQGYKWHHFFGKNKDPPVLTLFSAPNYSGKGNLAAYVITQGDDFDITQFDVSKKYLRMDMKIQNAFAYFLTDISVWVDEFLYCLFEHLNTMKADQVLNLQRSLTKMSNSKEEKNYFRQVKHQSFVQNADNLSASQKEDEEIKEPNEDNSTQERKQIIIKLMEALGNKIKEQKHDQKTRMNKLKMLQNHIDEFIDTKSAKKIIRMQRKSTVEQLLPKTYSQLPPKMKKKVQSHTNTSRKSEKTDQQPDLIAPGKPVEANNEISSSSSSDTLSEDDGTSAKCYSD